MYTFACASIQLIMMPSLSSFIKSKCANEVKNKKTYRKYATRLFIDLFLIQFTIYSG
ncbi:MAG: hypothetical protein BSOLF_2498 [Candidatus Carbobacillus altaicus]|uniref:Uncharacterized protein n=1 Tax=Candidatus Carbonibacillus altaicus TaxID=2163959 RepID=A0A2R6Y2L7_9BACL|nr:MAG: hypothetical protein BSOLF_2498 [Candidatus Carbobacillus altaicus]